MNISLRCHLRWAIAISLGAPVPGCATSVTSNPPPEVDAGGDPLSADGSIIVDAAELGCDGGDDCVSYPETCTTGMLCEVDVTFDDRSSLTGLWASSQRDVWATGSQGTILHYDGQLWTAVPSGVTETLRVVWGTAPDDVWIASTGTFVMHSQGVTDDGGVTWDVFRNEYPGVTTCASAGLWGTKTAGMWTAGICPVNKFAPGVLDSTGWQGADGPAWESEPTFAGEYHAITGVGEAKDLWAAGVYVSRNFGVPTQHGGALLIHRVSEDYPNWVQVNSYARVSLNALWASSSDDVWIAGNQGTLRHWNGTTVEVVDTGDDLATSNFLGIGGTGSRDLWLVGENALVVHYDGEHFTRMPVGGLEGARPTLHKIWASSTNDDVWIAGDGLLLGRKRGGSQ